jgi:hypothetical protein
MEAGMEGHEQNPAELDKDIAALRERIDRAPDAEKPELERQLEAMMDQQDLLRARGDPPRTAEETGEGLRADAEQAALELRSDIP